MGAWWVETVEAGGSLTHLIILLGRCLACRNSSSNHGLSLSLSNNSRIFIRSGRVVSNNRGNSSLSGSNLSGSVRCRSNRRLKSKATAKCISSPSSNNPPSSQPIDSILASTMYEPHAERLRNTEPLSTVYDKGNKTLVEEKREGERETVFGIEQNRFATLRPSYVCLACSSPSILLVASGSWSGKACTLALARSCSVLDRPGMLCGSRRENCAARWVYALSGVCFCLHLLGTLAFYWNVVFIFCFYLSTGVRVQPNSQICPVEAVSSYLGKCAVLIVGL